ncbi:MAG TPA: hypothetical protein VHE13_13140 [Opitutus sp.]|nr:hypothetical protein [Opitutus sp.]
MSVLNVTLAGSYLSGRVLAVLAVAMKYPPQPAAIAAPAVAPVARRHAVVRAAARSREPELAFGPRLAVAAQAG